MFINKSKLFKIYLVKFLDLIQKFDCQILAFKINTVNLRESIAEHNLK